MQRDLAEKQTMTELIRITQSRETRSQDILLSQFWQKKSEEEGWLSTAEMAQILVVYQAREISTVSHQGISRHQKTDTKIGSRNCLNI